jgi:hypothetical protein
LISALIAAQVATVHALEPESANAGRATPIPPVDLLPTAVVPGMATTNATAATKPVVVAVSDSLTNEEPTNWLAMLGVMRPDIRVVAEAHGGWTTKSYFKAKFDGVAWASLPERADVAIILIGSNNLFEDRGGSDASVQEAVDGVQKIEAYLRAKYPDVRIILVAPPTCVPERWTDRKSRIRAPIRSRRPNSCAWS